ncbi:MAG: homocysteine S-methyltransferase family protein [Candidatus Aminicenantes bacterium]
MSKALLDELLESRILVLDGAMGTQIQSFELTPPDFGGRDYFGCNEYLNITRPDVIEEIHSRYLEAGADIIETNSLCSSSLELAEFHLENQSFEICQRAAEIARKMANKYSSSTKPRFVAGNVGPTNRLVNVTGNISFDQIKAVFKPLISGLISGGAHIIIFETFPDTSNIKAAVTALKEVCKENSIRIPFIISVTVEPNGKMLAGQTIEALYTSVQHFEPFAVGINCGLGPKEVGEYIKALRTLSGCYVSLYPNAGFPDENGNFTLSAAEYCQALSQLLEEKYVNIIGGCCGTTPTHINALAKYVETITPEIPGKKYQTMVSGLENLVFAEENRPVIIGERTNMSGSKKFRELIRAKEFDKASEIAKLQVLKGAQIIDISLSDTETDEIDNIKRFYPLALKKIRTPVMIDSSASAPVLEEALKLVQGKGIINSINLENEKRFDDIAQLAQKYGAALIVLLIDEKGMAITKERKLTIAARAYDRLRNMHHIPESSIIFDSLVFSLGTGVEQFYLSAGATFAALAEIKKKYPGCKTSLGISNASFGLPAAGREALNSTYLYHAVKAGLDMAIVNSQKMVRYAALTQKEKELCRQMLYNNTKAVVEQFSDYFGDKKIKAKTTGVHVGLPLEKRLQYYIIEGIKTGLIDDLEGALKKYSPLEIINTHLMEAMAEVGKRFNANELTVIDVLQSAEVMKAAVDYLQPHLNVNDILTRGKILLATVKGDVHDIGKNLVGIILANNGYEVIDLGVKVDSQTISHAVKEHCPHAIGLSGLLVKSAQEMCITAEYLKNEGIDIPIYVGGAALSQAFAHNKIKPHYHGPVIYAQDAVKALKLLNDHLHKNSS